jgi:hypothetical protein
MGRLIFVLVLAGLMLTAGFVFAADEPTQAPEVVGNAKCPVSDKPVGGDPKAPTFFSDFKGYRVGFMCPVCKGKFDSKDDAGKLELLNKALKSVGKEPVK